MTTDDHDACRPTAGQDHRASDRQPDTSEKDDATGTNSAEGGCAAVPHSFPPRQAGRGRYANDAERSRLPFPLSLGGDDPAGEVVEALHQLGTPNRVDHDRLVGMTNEERDCGKGVFAGVQSNGASHVWPAWCRRHTHEEDTCHGHWAETWSERADLAFHDCPEVQVLITRPESMDSLHRSIRNQPADPRMFRLTLRFGGVHLILSNAPIRTTSRGVVAVGIARGSEVRSIVGALLITFHLDGADAVGSKRGQASEPVLPSRDFPDTHRDRPWRARRFANPEEGKRYGQAWDRELGSARLMYPELPEDFRTLERDHGELLLDIHAAAMAAAFDDSS